MDAPVTKAKSIALTSATNHDMALELRRRAVFSNDLAWKQHVLWTIVRLHSALAYGDDMVTSSAICLGDALALLERAIDSINKIPVKGKGG